MNRRDILFYVAMSILAIVAIVGGETVRCLVLPSLLVLLLGDAVIRSRRKN